AGARALTAEEPGLDEHFVACALHLAAGRRALLRADSAAARPELERAVELARRGASPVELAACLLACAEAGQRHALAEARATLARCPDPGILAEPPRRPAAPLSGELSERERAVLRLLPTELSQREIGSTLFVSLNTVKSHTRRIFAKLDASGREDAVRKARELGLL
ncbi:MAG: response regulator transcription factor, partial [Gaiellaceae bacterium]